MSSHRSRKEAGTLSSRTGDAGRRAPRIMGTLAMVIVLVLIDQATKYCAQRFLSPQAGIPVLGRLLSLRLLRNPGASLGMGASRTWVISLFAIAASCLLVWCIVRTDSWEWSITAGMALAGAVGNLCDRIIYATVFLNGTVVDFLDYGWSIGNVADIYLTCAAVVAIVLLLRSVPFAHERSLKAGTAHSPARKKTGRRADRRR